jgi:hypothetical protein
LRQASASSRSCVFSSTMARRPARKAPCPRANRRGCPPSGRTCRRARSSHRAGAEGARRSRTRVRYRARCAGAPPSLAAHQGLGHRAGPPPALRRRRRYSMHLVEMGTPAVCTSEASKANTETEQPRNAQPRKIHRDVLALIREGHDRIDVTPNAILQLHGRSPTRTSTCAACSRTSCRPRRRMKPASRRARRNGCAAKLRSALTTRSSVTTSSWPTSSNFRRPLQHGLAGHGDSPGKRRRI